MLNLVIFFPEKEFCALYDIVLVMNKTVKFYLDFSRKRILCIVSYKYPP